MSKRFQRMRSGREVARVAGPGTFEAIPVGERLLLSKLQWERREAGLAMMRQDLVPDFGRERPPVLKTCPHEAWDALRASGVWTLMPRVMRRLRGREEEGHRVSSDCLRPHTIRRLDGLLWGSEPKRALRGGTRTCGVPGCSSPAERGLDPLERCLEARVVRVAPCRYCRPRLAAAAMTRRSSWRTSVSPRPCNSIAAVS